MVKVSFFRDIKYEEYIALQAGAIYILKRVKKKYPFTKFRERITCNRLIKAIEKDACYMGQPWITMDDIITLDGIKPLEGDAIEDGEVVLGINCNDLYEFHFKPAIYIKLKDERVYDIDLKSIKHMAVYTEGELRCYMRLWPKDHELRNFIVSNHIVESDTRWNFTSGDLIMIETIERETQNPEILFTLTKIIDRLEGKNCRPD